MKKITIEIISDFSILILSVKYGLKSELNDDNQLFGGGFPFDPFFFRNITLQSEAAFSRSPRRLAKIEFSPVLNWSCDIFELISIGLKQKSFDYPVIRFKFLSGKLLFSYETFVFLVVFYI